MQNGRAKDVANGQSGDIEAREKINVNIWDSGMSGVTQWAIEVACGKFPLTRALCEGAELARSQS